MMDRRSPDAEAVADIAELDRLIADASPSVIAEGRAMAAKIDDRISQIGSLHAVNDQIIAGLHETDLDHATRSTAGALVAAAAMGVAHGRDERVAEWPTFDGLIGRPFWQKIAGWSDDEYAEAVSDSVHRAAAAHSTVQLEHSGHVADKVDHSLNTRVFHLLEEINIIAHVLEYAREDERQMVKQRSAMIADAEASAVYAAHKYRTQVATANDGDLLVYVTKDDGKVRPNHRALHMMAWSINSPVWRRIYPPNGLHCRCTIVKRSRTWAAKNLRPTSVRTTVPRGGGPDKGFHRDPRAKRKPNTAIYRPEHVSALAGRITR